MRPTVAPPSLPDLRLNLPSCVRHDPVGSRTILTEIDGLTSTKVATAWARVALASKNTLVAADVARVERPARLPTLKRAPAHTIRLNRLELGELVNVFGEAAFDTIT